MNRWALFVLFLASVHAFGQSSKYQNAIEFSLLGGSAQNMDFAAEVGVTHRFNDRIKLWNLEGFAGFGICGAEESVGPHLMIGARPVFGKKRHQVYGDFGGVYLLDLSNNLNGVLQPVVNLGYRYTPKSDDWHFQVSSGTWGLVALGAGLKW